MSSISGCSIDWTQWEPISKQNTAAAQTAENTQAATNPIYQGQVEETAGDQFVVSQSGETCTDGKDDGKIGLFSAIGNAIKGVGKTIVNGVKGMFTDKNGKFSLGKTLLSIGTAALCIAVPAVGVAACVVGGTMGAVQVGKGIYNAATAKTDAEAKEAWQNIGGGAFTVGMSVVGAKAGVKGMKSAAAKTDAGSALQALENAGTKFTPKTAGQYAKAFVQDGYRSGKYNIGNALNPIKETASLKHAEHKAGKIGKKQGLTDKELATIKEADCRRAFQSEASKTLETKINNVKTDVSKLPQNAFQKVTHPISSVRDLANSIRKIDFSKVNPRQIPSHLQSAYKFLATKEATPEVINKLGYDTVAELLALISGTELADQTV